MGEPKELRPGRGGFHENPSTCICEDTVTRVGKNSGNRKFWKDDPTKKNVANDEVDVDDNDDDNDEDQNDLTDQDMFNGTMSDYESLNFEDPELEEIISD